MTQERLHKYLSRAGVASRRAAEEWIQAGRVAVNGQIERKNGSIIPVILNLQGTDTDLSKRLIDFSSGLTYALDGGMQRIADKVFLLTPRDVERYPWPKPEPSSRSLELRQKMRELRQSGKGKGAPASGWVMGGKSWSSGGGSSASASSMRLISRRAADWISSAWGIWPSRALNRSSAIFNAASRATVSPAIFTA